jgi:hypothetical protein
LALIRYNRQIKNNEQELILILLAFLQSYHLSQYYDRPIRNTDQQSLLVYWAFPKLTKYVQFFSSPKQFFQESTELKTLVLFPKFPKFRAFYSYY